MFPKHTNTVLDLAMRALAPLILFNTYHKQDVIYTTDTGIPVNMTNYHQNVARSDVSYSDLGPVCVDRYKSIIFRTARGSSPDKLGLLSTVYRRKFMRALSLGMAYQYSDDNKLRLNTGEHMSKIARKGLAAYFLATTFGERLGKIEYYMELKNAAKWILWAHEKYGLRLEDKDIVRYKIAAEIQGQYESLPPTDIVLRAVQPETTTDLPQSKKERPRRVRLVPGRRVRLPLQSQEWKMQKYGAKHGPAEGSDAEHFEAGYQGMKPAVGVPSNIGGTPSAEESEKSEILAQLRLNYAELTRIENVERESHLRSQTHSPLPTKHKAALRMKTTASGKFTAKREKKEPQRPRTVIRKLSRTFDTSNAVEPSKPPERALPSSPSIVRKIGGHRIRKTPEKARTQAARDSR